MDDGTTKLTAQLASKAARVDAPTEGTGDQASGWARGAQAFKRRALLAAGTAFGLGLVKLARPEPVHAADVVLGANNSSSGDTAIYSVGAGSNFSTVLNTTSVAAFAGRTPDGTGRFGVLGKIGPTTERPPATEVLAAVYGVNTHTNGTPGVKGFTTDVGPGVLGTSNSGIGVHGQTSSASQPAMRGDGQGVGVLGTASGSGVGLWGTAVNGIALLGTSQNGIGLSGSTTANNVGVFGSADGAGKVGAIGLVGRSEAGTGVVGQGATAARFDGPVIINGTLTLAGGATSAAVRYPDGVYRRMYSVQATESWFEDVGTAELKGGLAEVDLDPELAAVVRGDDYRVFLTEIGDCGGLYVSRKGPHRFEVKSRAGATASGSFDYRLLARRKDIEGKRLERVDVKSGTLSEPLRLPNLPLPNRIPSLPPVPHTADPVQGDERPR